MPDVELQRSIPLLVLSGLLAALAACSAATGPEWVKVSETVQGDERFTIYAAPATASRHWNTVKMWSVMDTSAADRLRRSWKDEWEYDCEGKLLRLKSVNEYSDKMGSGEQIYRQTYPQGGWVGVNPGTLGETLWKTACGKE